MTEPEGWQVSGDAAEVYEKCFVPSIFGQWAPRVADVARVASGDRVLDVGCGTGVLARTAADRVAAENQVTGLDRNAGMLAVARRLRPQIDWRQGEATALPFADASYDVVLSQFALGDKDTLLDRCNAAGIHEAVIKLRDGTMTYPTIEVFVETEVKGSPLEALLDAESYQGFMQAAQEKLQQFRTADGAVVMPVDAFIITATKA